LIDISKGFLCLKFLCPEKKGHFGRIVYDLMNGFFPLYLVERHRKKKINAGINRIGELIPCSPALKQVRIHAYFHSLLVNEQTTF
jgi:hypothetical protein